MTSENLLCFNGINGATGNYDMAPMGMEQLVNLVKGESPPENIGDLKGRSLQGKVAHYGVVEGLDPTNMAEAGWGIIFPHNADEAVIEALQPLLDLRKDQTGDRFRIFRGVDGYRPNESKSKFLARHGMGPGPANPEKLPYYLMIAASPEVVPFSFQFQLDVQYAVGRLYFGTLDEYAAYAQTVVASETGHLGMSRNFHLLGVANPDDRATQLSLAGLVHPLAETFSEKYPDWQVTSYAEEEANKQRLLALLAGQERSALLFTASHGMSFPHGDTRQLAHQGALLCGEWPGPKEWKGSIPQDFYVAGDDVSDEAGPGGFVAFHHACYGAGVPLYDDFSRQAYKAREAQAPHPFVTGLPQRLLAHPKGGALAVVGHVDRAWGYSFDWPGSGNQTAVFESTLTRILDGKPVGLAMDYFNERYAELASELTTELEEMEFGKKANYQELAGTWTAHNDARDYVLLGDPAVRLPLSQAAQGAQAKQQLELRTFTPKAVPPPSEPASTMAEVPAFDVPTPPKSQPLPEDEPLKLSAPELAQRVLKRLNTCLESLEQVEVQTHSSAGIKSSTQTGPWQPEKHGAPAAYTRISKGGDLLNILPETGDTDKSLWLQHRDAVQLASEHRVAMLRAIGEVLSRLIPSK